MSNVPPCVVVDDTDSRILYEGGWLLDRFTLDASGNFGPTWNHTLHRSASNGSFSYTFGGSNLVVIGSNNITNHSGIIDPAVECFVDGSLITVAPPFPFEENKWTFCETAALKDGTHILTVNTTSRYAQPFLFDYLTYVPSADVPLNDATMNFYFTDPIFQYSSGWSKPEGYSVMLTSIRNASAYIEFEGIALTWFGVIPNSYPGSASSGTYKLDGEEEVFFSLQGEPSPQANTQYGQIFFQFTGLMPGKHNITVKNLGDNTTTPLTVSSIFIRNSKLPITFDSPPTPPHDPVSPPGTGSVQHQSVSIGVAVGLSLGGLSFVTLAVFLCLYLFRRKTETSRIESSITPFVHLVENIASVSPHGHSRKRPPSRPRYGDSSIGYRGEWGMASRSQTASARQRSPRVDIHSSPPHSTGRVIRHEDSGIRMPELPANTVESPPYYAPI